MAAPTFVAVGTLAEGTGDITPGLPAGWQENDILVIVAECGQADAGPTSSGYAHITGSPIATTVTPASNTKLSLLWKRATASESDPLVTDAGNHTSARVIAIRGCTTSGNPWDVTATAFSDTEGTSGNVPGATTTVADCLILLAGSEGLLIATGTGQFGGWANGDLTDVTHRATWHTTQGNDGGCGIATGVKAAAGAYGNTSFTLLNASAYAAMSVAFKPPAAASHNLVIQDSVQAQTTDNVTLTQTHLLVIQNSAQAQTTQNVTLTDPAEPSSGLNTNDLAAAALIALYGGPETNVGALINRFRAENDLLDWDEWCHHICDETGIDNCADAANTFWAEL